MMKYDLGDEAYHIKPESRLPDIIHLGFVYYLLPDLTTCASL